MNKIKKLFSMLVVVLPVFLTFNIIPIYAADDVTVFLDGKQLIYDDAKPLIINSRAMVPIRKTADYFGMTTDWNAKTETMTFTKGNRTIVHTMRSNIIYINGQAMTFDTPSQNVQNRTVVPVRMLSEAMGATVEWDNANRKVIITTASTEVTHAEISKSVINSGETVYINVVASKSTEKVKVTDGTSGTLINESFVYTENVDGSHVFSLPWTPYETTSQTKTFKIYAGNSGGYNELPEATKSVVCTVSMDSTPKIKNYYVDRFTAKRNDTVKVTVYTNSGATKVKIENDFDSNKNEVTSYTKSGDNNVFEAKVKMTQKGTCQLYVYAGGKNGYSTEYATISIDVSNTGSSSSSSGRNEDDVLEIYDIEVDDDDVSYGDTVRVDVTTTYDVEKVRIFEEDKNVVASTTTVKSKDRDDNECVWRLDFEVTDDSKTGTVKYYVYAYADGDDVYDTFKLSVDDDDSNSEDDDLKIKSITQSRTSIAVGESTNIKVKTTRPAEYIKAFDKDDKEVAYTKTYDSEYSQHIFTFSYTLEKKNYDTITIYAYDKDDKKVSKKYTLNYEENEEPEIIDIDADSTVRPGKKIDVTVTTNDAVAEVYIEDEDGRKVESSTRYSDKSDDEYTWELSFDAEDDEGKYKYTVYAENDDGDEDKDTFSVRVRD